MSTSTVVCLIFTLLGWTEALTITGTDNTKWELIYRFSTNRTEDPLDLYLSQTMINNDFIESQLLNTSINIHYKTDFVSNWNDFNVLKVKLSFYQNFSEEAYYIFDGTDSNSTNWFDENRLLNTSYTEMINRTIEAYNNNGTTYNDTQVMFSLYGEYGTQFVAEIRSRNCSTFLSLITTNYTESGINVISCIPDIYKNTTSTIIFQKYANASNISITNTSYTEGDFIAIFVSVEEWCSCNKARKMSNSIISDKIQTLKKELTIDIKQTNAYLRTKISVYERRPGPVTAGVTGLVFLTIVIVGLFIFDLQNIWFWIKHGYYNIRTRI